jgi:hypothetical protein
MAVRGNRCRLHCTAIAHAAASIERCVAVQEFFPEAAPGDPDAIVVSRNRGKIGNTDEILTLLPGASEVGEH